MAGKYTQILGIVVFLFSLAAKTESELWRCKRPTVYPDKNFNASVDALTIKIAMDESPPEADTIRQILVMRTSNQRQAIKTALKDEYGINLNLEFESLYPYNLMTQYLLTTMMMTPIDLQVFHLREATEGIGTKEHVITEILCTKKTNDEINKIKTSYKKKYDVALAKQLFDDTSGDFRDFLSSIMLANRSNTSEVTEVRTDYLIKTLQEYRDPDNGLQINAVNDIFIYESYGQLSELINKYSKVTGQSLMSTLKDYFYGDYLNALLALVESIQDPHTFYARRLYKAMEGLGTDDHTLIRIIVLRADIDLGCIKDAFERLYGDTLESWVEGETSGKYQETLLNLIREV